MKQKHYWVFGWGVLLAIALAIALHFVVLIPHPDTRLALAQPTPTVPASPSSAFPPAPPSPSLLPLPSPSPMPIAPPASTAPPFPLDSNYKDPGNRFAIGVLKGFKVSPLAGTVLMEAPDGNLAYSVIPQSQPSGTPIGISPDYRAESLAKVATTVFQRGEGFQPGPPTLEAGGGIVMNWTGALTIGGNVQPVGGMILVRPSAKQIVLVLIAATQTGASQLPGAVSALASSLQVL